MTYATMDGCVEIDTAVHALSKETSKTVYDRESEQKCCDHDRHDSAS